MKTHPIKISPRDHKRICSLHVAMAEARERFLKAESVMKAAKIIYDKARAEHQQACAELKID